MSVNTTVQIVGVEDAIKQLRRIEPELRKQFNRDAADIAQPAVTEAQQKYPEMPLSGMSRQWQSRGRPLFPYSAVAARRNVKVKIDTSRKTRNVILIQQRNPGAVIFETAGRKIDNALGRSLGVVAPDKTRVLEPAVTGNRDRLERGFQELVRKVMRIVERQGA